MPAGSGSVVPQFGTTLSIRGHRTKRLMTRANFEENEPALEVGRVAKSLRILFTTLLGLEPFRSTP